MIRSIEILSAIYVEPLCLASYQITEKHCKKYDNMISMWDSSARRRANNVDAIRCTSFTLYHFMAFFVDGGCSIQSKHQDRFENFGFYFNLEDTPPWVAGSASTAMSCWFPIYRLLHISFPLLRKVWPTQCPNFSCYQLLVMLAMVFVFFCQLWGHQAWIIYHKCTLMNTSSIWALSTDIC